MTPVDRNSSFSRCGPREAILRRGLSVAMLRRVLWEAMLLVLLALIPALLAGWLHPRRPDFEKRGEAIQEITISAALKLSGPVLWIDARSEDSYSLEHIPDAVSLNEDQWEAKLPAVVHRWRPGTVLVVYCDHQQCLSSQEVARRLRRELAVESVFVLQGGWQSWKERRR